MIENFLKVKYNHLQLFGVCFIKIKRSLDAFDNDMLSTYIRVKTEMLFASYYF